MSVTLNPYYTVIAQHSSNVIPIDVPKCIHPHHPSLRVLLQLLFHPLTLEHDNRPLFSRISSELPVT